MTEILIDSSFALSLSEFRTDIMGQLENILQGKPKFILVEAIRNELCQLAASKSKKGPKARVALEVLKGFQVVGSIADSPDDAIVEYANKHGNVVATNDAHLRRRLRKLNVPVVFVRKDGRVSGAGIP